MSDPDCICEGNWRNIVKEHKHLLGKLFTNEWHPGEVFCFFGIVHTYDDYCYGMSSKKSGVFLGTCVGTLEDNGFSLITDDDHEAIIRVA